jgi:hypothetical protein
MSLHYQIIKINEQNKFNDSKSSEFLNKVDRLDERLIEVDNKINEVDSQLKDIDDRLALIEKKLMMMMES